MKIPTEDFIDETLAIDDTYGDDVREIVVLVMEVDKVAFIFYFIEQFSAIML